LNVLLDIYYSEYEMISLILTIFCSSSIALLLKHNDSKSGNAVVLLAGNYFTASILGLVFLLLKQDISLSIIPILFGAVLAFLFVLSFFSFAKAVNAAGTALAVLSSRLSVVLPVILSMLFYSEEPGKNHYAGFIFAVLTIAAFYLSLKNMESKQLNLKNYIYLLILFIGIGINDFCMKVFNQMRPADAKEIFLFSIFLFSFIYCMAVIMIKKLKFEKPAFYLGNFLGVPNIFSSFFLLGALAELPAIIVYPLVNIGTILLTTFAAMGIWKEKLNKYGLAALVTGAVSIVLLSI